uniref:Uncharacterized protein n=2 Tax=Helianthus annuus TaxID=4232 RepID=A0A251TQX2_HELAN
MIFSSCRSTEMLLIFSPKPLNIVVQNGSDHDTGLMADVGSDQEDHSVAVAKHIEVADKYDVGEYGDFLSSKVSFIWLFYV